MTWQSHHTDQKMVVHVYKRRKTQKIRVLIRPYLIRYIAIRASKSSKRNWSLSLQTHAVNKRQDIKVAPKCSVSHDDVVGATPTEKVYCPSSPNSTPLIRDPGQAVPATPKERTVPGREVAVVGTGMTAAAALLHHQGPDHNTNDRLDRPVPVPAQDQNQIFEALPHLSATHGPQPDLAINRHPGCYLGRQRERLAGEYVNFDTILTEVTTNKGGVPMATKASISGSKRRHVRDISS